MILHDVERATPTVAERFRECIAEEPIDVGEEHPVIVTASVGGASMPADAASLTELLRLADRALYTAKSMGHNRVQIGAHGDESGIEGLMERGSVLNFVQALVDYVDLSYGAIDHGSEAARWTGLVADEMGLDAGQRWRACAAAASRHRQALGAPGDPGQARHARSRGVEGGPPPPRRRRGHTRACPGLRDVAEAVRQHHERYDGGGYPAGLAGERTASRRAWSPCATRGKQCAPTACTPPRRPRPSP